MSALSRRVSAFEVKAVGDGGTFEGYASVFGVVDAYADVVVPGAFKRTLRDAKGKGRWPAMLWQHDSTQPIGVWTDVAEDEQGLYAKGRLAETTVGRDAYELLKVGALSGLSIGYRTVKARVQKETAIRELIDVDLFEISPVTFPALDVARVTAVKAADWDEREWETRLRESLGLSRTQAQIVIARGVKALLRESEHEGARDAEMAAAIHALAARLRVGE